MKKIPEVEQEERDVESGKLSTRPRQLPCSALEFLTGESELDEKGVSEFRNVVSLLSKEQLVDILSKSAYLYGVVGSACKLIVERSPVSRRVMVRNISFQTSDRVFLSFFERFGEVEDSTIIREKNGRSRGYGFVTYKKSDSIKKLFNENLVLSGRQLLVKLAADPFSEFTCGPTDDTKQVLDPSQRFVSTIFKKKLFIRSLSETTTDESLRKAFSEFEDIEECFVMRDHNTGRSRRYGFITFRNISDMMKALQNPERIVDGKVAFVSLAFRQKETSSGGGGANTRKKVDASGSETKGVAPQHSPPVPIQSGYFYDCYGMMPQAQPDLQSKSMMSENTRSQHQFEGSYPPYANSCYYLSNPCFGPYFIPYAGPYGIYSNPPFYVQPGDHEHDSKDDKDRDDPF